MVCGLHWHWLHDSAIDAGIVQAAGSIIAGGAASAVAWMALGSWRSQEIEKRGIGYAEECMAAADEVVAFVGVARSRVTTISLKDVERSPDRIYRRVLEGQAEALHAARSAMNRCRSTLRRLDLVTGTDQRALVDSIETPLRRLSQIYLLIEYLSDPPPDDADQRTELANARSDFLGLPRPSAEMSAATMLEHQDSISVDLEKAHSALETSLRPILSGRRKVELGRRRLGFFKPRGR